MINLKADLCFCVATVHVVYVQPLRRLWLLYSGVIVCVGLITSPTARRQSFLLLTFSMYSDITGQIKYILRELALINVEHQSFLQTTNYHFTQLENDEEEVSMGNT